MNSDKKELHFSSLLDSALPRILSYHSSHRNIVLWRLLLSPEFLFSFIILIILRIFSVILGFLPSFFTDAYLSRLSQFSSTDIDNMWVYYHCLFIVFLLYFQCFIGELIETYKYSFFLRLKLWLNFLLLDKSFRIQVLAKNDQKSSSSPNIINVITQDVQRLESGLRSFIETFGILGELCIGVCYLYNQISNLNFSFSGLFWLISILMIGNISIVGISQIFGLKGHWARDKRVWVLQEVFQGIRAIKTLCWEDIFEGKILKTRKEEFSNIRMIRIIDAFFNSLIRSIGFIIMLVLSVWLEGTQLKMDLYSSLVLINQLVYPITAFPWNIGNAIGCIFPYMRLQSHFKAKETQKKEDFSMKNPDTILEIRNLEFQWSNEMQGLNIKALSMRKGELIMIYGANGSGKTTLLRLILGELTAKNGYIYVNKDKLAYVSQDTWLIDSSFQENIVLDETFNEEKYRNCLNCCSLLEEIQVKEKGFNLGLNGNKLSGGQRQRVSLCRALYQEKELYLLDDVFSSLDEKVAQEIFKEYVMKGLISQGKTVLFITSQEKYLAWAHKAFELKGGSLINFEKKILKNMVFQEENNEENMKALVLNNESLENDKNKEKTLEYIQPFAWIGIRKYLQTLGTKTFLLILLISLIQQAAKHYSEIFFNNILTSPQSQAKNENSYNLAIIYMILTIARGLFYCFGVLKVSQIFFKEILKMMLNANMEFFEKYQPGELINYLTRDIDSIDCGLPENVNGWASTMINIIGIFAVISYEFPMLIALCWIIANKAFKYYQNYSKNNKIQNQNMKAKEARLLNEIMELSQGLIMIRAFQKQGFFLKKAMKTLKDFLLECSKSQISHRNIVVQTSLLTLSASSSILLFSLLYFAFQNMPYHPKALGIALSYSLLLSRHLIDAICCTISLETELISLQRLTALEIASKKPLIYSIESKKNQTKDSFSSSLITFNGVYLKYGETPTFSLENISFSIKKGEKVAFCGRTGSGKSSIFSLLFKFYPYHNGQILYQDKDLALFEAKELRNSIAMIPQNGFLFKGTLKENFDPNNRFKAKEIEDILRDYEIEDVFIGKSLDFMVEKEGGNLSNGEKQMVNFLQNVLTEKPVILLDEATSNLDEKLDQRIMNLLRKICQNKTLLLISHRLENLDFFDRIHVLEKGQIKESGTFETLSKEPLSLFNSLKTQL